MRNNGTAGFSLVEVMAAIVILGIAMTAVFSTFLFQQQSYTTQVRVAEMQQNLRDAMEMVSRDIRMCTYGIPSTVNIVDNEILSDSSGRFLKSVNSTSGPDEITVLYRYDGDAASPSDNVSVTAGATTVTLTSTAGFVAGDRILVYNATNSDLRRVTAVSASPATLTFLGGLADYSAGGTLARVRYVRYYVDSSTGHPTLMLDKRNGQPPQPLADDIEDLQLTYSMDTDANGTIDLDNNVAGNASFVRQVHIYLLARSRITEKGWKDTGDRNMADHTPGAANDGYRRRRTETVVDVRNSNF